MRSDWDLWGPLVICLSLAIILSIDVSLVSLQALASSRPGAARTVNAGLFASHFFDHHRHRGSHRQFEAARRQGVSDTSLRVAYADTQVVLPESGALVPPSGLHKLTISVCSAMPWRPSSSPRSCPCLSTTCSSGSQYPSHAGPGPSGVSYRCFESSSAHASLDELLHRHSAPGLPDMAGGLPAVPVLLCLIVDDHDTMTLAATIPCISYSTGLPTSRREARALFRSVWCGTRS